MKSKLLLNVTIIFLFFFPNLNFGQAPSITTQPTNEIVCEGTSVSFSVTATGAALTYQWRKGNVNLVDGGNISGSNTAILTINPVSVADASSDFNVIVSGAMAPNDTSDYVVLDVNTAPNITTQPVNQTICGGDTVRLSVVATGFNLTYQWRKGSTNLMSGGNILDATSATLVISPVTVSDSSSFYNVIVTGGCPPNDTSVDVSILVNPATTIVTQPTNQLVCLGNSASFSVGATGSGLTYQWRKGNVNLVNGLNISGANTATLTINPVTALDTASDYNVIVSGGCGNDTSINVFLRFNNITITGQPSNETVCSGAAAGFSVTTTGMILSYQWMKGNVILTNGGNISGANTASLSINPATIADTSSFYHVVIIGSCALIDSSVNVYLRLNTAPTITAQPTSQTVCSGSAVIFSLGATGTGLTYQWMNGSTNLANGGNISGANTATLTINPTNISDTSSFYHVVITGACAPSATSANVYLKINVTPIITTQPTSQTVCLGSAVSFSVAANGTGFSYQWMNGSTNLANGGNISGANTATLTINPANISDTSSFYHVVITGLCPPTATSINVYLKLNTAPTITTQPTSQTVCSGNALSFSVGATGAGLTYQWMNGNTVLTNIGNTSGTNTATLTINPANISDTSSFYHVVITGACAPSATSTNVYLKVNITPTITAQPTSQTVCSGSSVTFSVNATGTGLTYQWMNGNTALTNGGNISGANTATLTINPTNISDTSSFYHVVITGACAPSATSTNVYLHFSNPIIITQPTSQTVCSGNAVNFSVGATGTGLTYQWMNGSTNLANGGNILGANTATLTINPANISDTSSFYHVVITGACAPSATSINVYLKLNTAPTIVTQPTSQTVCSGNAVNFSVGATGTGLTYQWMNGSTNLANGGNISGTNTATLTINPTSISDTSSFYHVVITGACAPSATSANVYLKINVTPTITTQPTSQIVCSGSLVSFSVGATGTGLTYQWMNGNTVLTNSGNISGANTTTLTVNPTNISDTSSFYHVVISGVCAPSATSTNVYLKLNTAPTITAQPTSQTVCSGNAVSFLVGATGTGLTYQWMNGSTNLANGGNISGAATASLTINPTSISDTSSFYHVVITGTCAPNATSTNVYLHINSLPVVTASSNTTSVCAGSSVIFTGGGASSYTWTNGVTNGVVYTPTSTNTYTVTGTDGNSCSNTATITVNVNNLPANTPTANSPVCIGGPLNLSTPTVNGATYSWAGPNGFTSSSQNPTISSAAIIDAGTYSLTVSNSTCSSNATVSVSITNCAGTDLSVVKTVDNIHPLIGNNVVFTITAHNNGPNNASGVVIGDTLQSGYTYVSSTATKGNYNSATGIWTIDTLNNGASATLIVTAKVNKSGNYTNTAAIHGNAPDTNMVNNSSTIETFPTDFFIPEGFSPNGDGINDMFVIRGIDNYPHNAFTVFNRWGDKVYTADDYQSNWDGKATMGLRVGGDDLPVGTYFYTLDLGDGSKVYKGSIYLNK